MKKFFKTILFLGGATVAAHFGIKAFKRVNGAVKLAKSLPEFLSNVYGEFPQVDVNRSLNALSIKIGFTAETLEKHDDVENTVREYIDDFYPEVSKGMVDIEIYEKGEEEGEAGEPESETDTEE